MRDRLIPLLLSLSPRERWLLAGLAGLGLPLALIFLWILPLSASRTAAEQALAEARALEHWVAARAAEAAALDRARPAPPETPQGALGISGIEESLKQAGLRAAVTRLANRDGGAIDLSFEAVEFSALTGWLTEIEPTWGYQLGGFRFERGAQDGLVSADFLLEVAQ